MDIVEKVEYILKHSIIEQSAMFYKRSIAVIGVIILLCLSLLQTPVLDILKYIGFQAFYIFLPGYLIYHLLKFDMQSVSLVFFSYAFGIAWMILQFLFLAAFQWLPGLYYLGPLMSIMAMVILWRRSTNNKNEIYNSVKKIPLQLWFIYASLLLVAAIGLMLPNPQPGLLSASSYYQDILWNMGNAEALLNHFPPYDLRVSDVVFKYHFFAPAYLAAISYITKIDLFTIVYRFYHISQLFLISGAVYSLGIEVLQEKRKALFFTWIYFFSSCASMIFAFRNSHGVFSNYNFSHITHFPICGYDLALPMYLLAAALCIVQLKTQLINWRYLLPIMLLVFICTGSKGPSGFMILGSLLITFVIGSLFSRSSWSTFALLLTTTFTAVFVYFYFIRSSEGNSGLSLHPGFTVQNSPIGRYFPRFIQNQYLVSTIELMLAPIHFFCFLPFASIPFISWCIKKLKDLKVITSAEIFIGSLAISGIGLTYLLAQSGHSQLYFIMLSTPFIELIAVLWLAENYNKLSKSARKVFASLLVIATASMFFSVAYDIKNGVEGIVNIYKDKYQVSDSQPEWDSMTRYEYEAMAWLKNNTSQGSVIASDRYYREPNQKNSRYFYYSTFSGKQFFLEGWEYESEFIKENVVPQKLNIMNELYMNKGPSKSEIMKQNNIDYVIVSRFITPDSKAFDKTLDIVFTNRDIKIYQNRSFY